MKKYSKYKDSGVIWIGEVPTTWSVKKLKYLLRPKADALKTGPFGSHLKNSDIVENGEFKVYTQRNVLDDDFDNGDDFINSGKFDSLKSFKVEPLDILITTRGTIGRCSLFPHEKREGILHPCLIRFQVDNEKVDSNWVMYYINDSSLFFNNIKFNSNSTIIDVIYGYTLKEVFFPVPPLDEQKTILKYLKYKIAQIDKLISDKEKLIDFLNEERTVIINNAVTKGLNPNVLTVDSDIEWLGEIPNNWKISKLKFHTNKIIDGAHFTPTYIEDSDGIPFLRVKDIHDKTINLNEVKRIPLIEHLELTKRCKPEKGDVLLSKNGTIGLMKVVDWDWEFSVFVSLCLLKFKSDLLNRFFIYFFESNIAQQQIFESSQKTSVTNLHLEKIKELILPIPSIVEQQLIVDYLDVECNRIDEIVFTINGEIELLKEYKTALISEVVTGKVDVRDEVIAETMTLA